jgi:hypothetical protein
MEIKPGENIFEAYQRQRDEMKLQALGMKLPVSSKADIPPVDKTAQAFNSTNIQVKEKPLMDIVSL